MKEREPRDIVATEVPESTAAGKLPPLQHDDTFAIFDVMGDVYQSGTDDQGLYQQGARHLSRHRLLLDQQRPLLLGSAVSPDNLGIRVDLTNPDRRAGGELILPRDSLHLQRRKILFDGCQYEHLRVLNFHSDVVTLILSWEFSADFKDLFEIRGFRPAGRGRDLPAEVTRDTVLLGYLGRDGRLRQTRLAFSPPPDHLGINAADYLLSLTPGGSIDLYLLVDCRPARERPLAAWPDFADALRAERLAREEVIAGVQSDHLLLNAWLARSRADLQMLVATTAHGPYPYAGLPWYATPFGRDGLLTAWLCLWVWPDLARGVLLFLAAHQGTRVDPGRDEEPGKILHELRQGEIAAVGEVPFACYYGSVDATLWFIILAEAYVTQTGDYAFLARIWPHLEAALGWIDTYGDCDGDGFVEYRRQSPQGLINQGWKDSHDAVFHADGSLAEGPIALVEVQSYLYGAWHAAARLARLLGQDERAGLLSARAESLKAHFEDAFWCDELDCYAMALDRSKRPCAVVSSNAGQALLFGLCDPARAARTARTLLGPGSWSGWGIRTVAEGTPRYNPMSYHNGSVWPHDNALIAIGLARLGLRAETLQLFEGMFAAARQLENQRLPELICGFHRTHGEKPVPYTVACSPLAMAAASSFAFVQACLGLTFHTESPQVRLDTPRLPPGVDEVVLSDVPAGGGRISLRVFRTRGGEIRVEILACEGGITVQVRPPT